MNHRLTQLINALPEPEKQILALRFHEKLTFREIGMVLDIRTYEVAQQITFIIAKLKFHLQLNE